MHKFHKQKNATKSKTKESTQKKLLHDLPPEVVAHKIISFLISDLETFQQVYMTSRFFKKILDTYYTLNIRHRDIIHLEPLTLVFRSLFQDIPVEYAFKCDNIKKIIETVIKKIKRQGFVYVRHKPFYDLYSPILDKHNFEETLLNIFTHEAHKLHTQTYEMLDDYGAKFIASPLAKLYYGKKLNFRTIMQFRRKILKPLQHTHPLPKKIAEKAQEYIANARTKYDL